MTVNGFPSGWAQPQRRSTCGNPSRAFARPSKKPNRQPDEASAESVGNGLRTVPLDLERRDPQASVLERHDPQAGAPRSLHWQPPPAPEVVSRDFRFSTEPLITGWNRALERPVSRRGRDGPTRHRRTTGDPDSHSPGVNPRTELRVPRAVRDRGPQAGSQRHGPQAGNVRWRGGLNLNATRIRPPEDVIKLEDRLNYLLQPPLEALLSDRELAMPLAPFPFQFEGVAFLYPRQAAILADEMGLGKTMQAITTIRLLLRRGEIRSVLMVCPKPLVTNWQREFQLWAPEVPTLAIEGDQARRAWQWRLADVPLRIANYEVVVRDREILERGEDGRPISFDLVVLDESQRIKNRGSTTSEVVRGLSRRRSWALTGTPVENSAEDLVGIFEFLRAGLPFARDEAAEDGPHRERLCLAADEGASPRRPAAQIVPRRPVGARTRAARDLSPG